MVKTASEAVGQTTWAPGKWRPGDTRAPTDFHTLPHGTVVENVAFSAVEGARCHGVLYRKGGERTVACITHPRGDLTRHYMIPSLLEAGYAVFGFTHRAGIVDYALIHEEMLLDIAGAIGMLKTRHEFDKIVLLANSGGGGIFGFYQWQAETAPPGRLTHTAAGDPLDLNSFDLPAADGLILLAVAFGESSVVARNIDPSVIDETDPLSCDPTLDMYDPENGYRDPPESSRYDPDFVERYRVAQSARIARIDAYARSLIAEQRHWQAQMNETGYAKLSAWERVYIKRRATDTKPVRVYRVDANLASCDLSLYPSKRIVGTFLSLDTLTLNYSRGTTGQLKSPRAWLSAASILSSRSTLRLGLPHIHVPTIIINFTADRGIYQADVEEMLSLSATTDKVLVHVEGEHFGFPIEGGANLNPRATVEALLTHWLLERFRTRN